MWKTRHVAMISWWPFNSQTRDSENRRGAATGAIRILPRRLQGTLRSQAGEDSVAAPDARPVAEVTPLSVQGTGIGEEAGLGGRRTHHRR